MIDTTKAVIDHTERPYLLFFLGCLGLLGCMSLLAGTLIAPYFVPDHDVFADTISDLAAGENEIIMDIALYGFAAGLMAIALAASHAHLGGALWSAGTVFVAILAVLVIIIGARNEYGDGDNEGVVIHVYLVYGLGLFFLVAPLCLYPSLRPAYPHAANALLALAALWGLASPIFFFLPTGMDGLYERGLGVIACAMVVLLSLVFIARGREAMHRRGVRAILADG